MVNKQKFVAFEVKRKGRTWSVDCSSVIGPSTRKQAAKALADAEIKPIAVLTEREANKTLAWLKVLLDPKRFDKNHEHRLLALIKKSEKKSVQKQHKKCL